MEAAGIGSIIQRNTYDHRSGNIDDGQDRDGGLD